MARKFLVKAVLVVFFITASTIGLPFRESQAAVKYISFGTGDPGGTYYFLGALFAQIINRAVPGVRVIAESTQGANENINYVKRKKIDIALTAPTSLTTAGALDDVRLIGMGHIQPRHFFVRKDSPIKSLADFRGRRVVMGSPGSGTFVSSMAILKGVGTIKIEDIKPANLSFSETITAMKDGNIDVGNITGGIPVASLLDLSRQIPLRLISFSEEEMNNLIAKYPAYIRSVIPGGTYTGIDTDTVATATVTILVCHKDMSDDLIYQMTKAVFEPSKLKDAGHSQAREWNVQNIRRGADYITKFVPFHPGVIKYLKEKGVWKEVK